MRASFEASLGSTKSLDGLDVLAGSGLAVEVGGSGVEGLGAAFVGFERVRAIAMISPCDAAVPKVHVSGVVPSHGTNVHVGVATRRTRPIPAKSPCFTVSGEITAGGEPHYRMSTNAHPHLPGNAPTVCRIVLNYRRSGHISFLLRCGSHCCYGLGAS